MKRIDILIADDHDLVLEGLLVVVKSFPFVEGVIGVKNGQEVLDHLKLHKPDLVLMDLDMPVMDGLDATEVILKKYPDVSIIILSGFTEDKIIYHMIEMGVHGYKLKNSKPEELKEAIERVITGGYFYDEMVVDVMRKGIVNNSGRPNFHPKNELTIREKQLLKLICQEKTTKEIAEGIYLSDRTVEKIRASLAVKLNVKGTVGLVKFAIKNGYDL